MNAHDEHDDDLEPEVDEASEIETENYPVDQELTDDEPDTDAANVVNRAEGQPVLDFEEDEPEEQDDAGDTI